MTKSTNPADHTLELFEYLYKHHPNQLLHHRQFADKLGIPSEPFRRIVEAGLGPWWQPAPTERDHGEPDYWFVREMLHLWRDWLLKSAPINDLEQAIQIVVDWDISQPVRDYIVLDDCQPHEYFRYFLDREYIL